MAKPHSPITPKQQRDLLHFLQQAFHLDLTGWHSLHLCHRPLGYLNPRWQQQLQADIPDLLETVPDGTNVNCQDWLHCADVLQNMGRDWHDLGLFGGWRNERFDVVDGDEALFALERSLFRPLGLLSKAVHLNGFTQQDGDVAMWIGKRSPFKAVDPDKLDNLVGGGVASGESVDEACAREGFEEAGLDSAITAVLPKPRRILSQRMVNRGLHREHISVYDLDLPSGIQPENQDGEVASFQLMGIADITDAMLTGRFMHDAMLVTLDGWLQRNILPSDGELGIWLQQQRC